MKAQQAAGDSVPRLPVGRYRIWFEAQGALNWRGFLGSAWRGALGHSLRGVVCITKVPNCPDCLLYHACVYPYIFETPPPPDTRKLSKYTAAPHPFVLELPFEPPPAASRLFMLGLCLFGRSNRYLAYLVHALGEAAGRGISRQRDRLQLLRVEQERPLGSGRWQSIHEAGGPLEPLGPEVPGWPAPNGVFQLRFLTPLRLRANETYVDPAAFRFSHLFGNLLRRISLLTYFHTDSPLETDFARLVRLAREVSPLRVNLQWLDWERYSSRQKLKLRMGGLTGAVDLDASQLADLWPYIWLGQWTHAGKGTSMGLGRFEIRRLDSGDATLQACETPPLEGSQDILREEEPDA